MNPLIIECFPIIKEDIQIVRKLYDKSENDITDMVEHLKIWLKKQPHIPEGDEDARLEIFLLKNKFRIEQTKIKLDNYYTLRRQHIDINVYCDPTSQEIQDSMKSAFWAPMPVLTPNKERVYIWKMNKEFNHLYQFSHMMRRILSAMEFSLSYDYTDGHRYIFDFDGYNMTHLKTVETNFMLKVVNLHQEAFSGRMAGVEFINGPFYIDFFLRILKVAVKPKLFAKLRSHKNYMDIHQHIPVECLPEEYGGKCKSVQYYHEKLCKLMVEEKDFIYKQASRVSDESKRIGDSPLNYIFGTEGSFRKINID